MPLLDEFRDFIIRGNVLDLAVAVVMGAAFNALVTAMVTDLVTPLIGIPGHVNFSDVSYTVNNSTFKVGAFVNSLITFLSMAVAVFFFIIKPVSRFQAKKEAVPGTKDCPYCLSKVPIKATRCAFCTSKLSK